MESKSKSYPRAEKAVNHSSRGAQEARGQSSSSAGSHGKKNNMSQSRYEQDSSSDQWESSGSGSSRSKSKSTWRPVREVLNVDTVLNELEQRRQQQLDSPRHNKPCPQERVHSDKSRERGNGRTRDEWKQKCLMTIYEDEQRHETESHSSVESESKTNQQRGTRLKGCPKSLLRSDTWTIQRTESGYESSDRLSSGSTNPDSPGVDGFALKDPRATPDGPTHSQVPQKGMEAKSSVTSSPSLNGKHPAKTQGKNHEQGSHSHLKCSPCSRRKLKYSLGASKKAASSERDCGSDSRPSEHGGESSAPRHFTKTSSSEWNSSDDLALSEPEDRDCLYRPGSSEAAALDCPPANLPYHTPHGNGTIEAPQANVQRQLGTSGSPHLRPSPRVASHQGEASHAAFRPRMLQEPFPPGLHLSASPHRKPDSSGLQIFSDGSSKSGSDPERSTPSSCESEERPCRVEQVPPPPPPQEVSLTTYFTVDNCMTETYRLKYHNQRPLVLSATVPRTGASERRDTSHTFAAETRTQDAPKSKTETSHNSNKPTAKWNPVTAKGLDERGFL